MEWDNEEAVQESTSRGPRQIGWFGRSEAERRANRENRRRGGLVKPREKTCRLAQRQTPTTAMPKQGLVEAVSVIRSRFGYGAVGLGCSGIRYSAATLY